MSRDSCYRSCFPVCTIAINYSPPSPCLTVVGRGGNGGPVDSVLRLRR